MEARHDAKTVSRPIVQDMLQDKAQQPTVNTAEEKPETKAPQPRSYEL